MFTYLSDFGPSFPFKFWRPFQIRARITQQAIDLFWQVYFFNDFPLNILTQYVNNQAYWQEKTMEEERLRVQTMWNPLQSCWRGEETAIHIIKVHGN